MLYIRCSDFTHFITESLYLFTSFSLFPLTPAPGNHFFILCFHEFTFFFLSFFF